MTSYSIKTTKTCCFLHILSCTVMSREKEPVMQLYTEFKSFFKKEKLKKKSEKIALSFTIPFRT